MDLFIDIMSRLSVKSLLRFKSVSKTFYNMIKSPNFIKQHLTRSKQNPNLPFSAVLSLVMVRETGKQFFRINLMDALHKPIDLGFPFLSDDMYFSILGICNGLVCVMMYNRLSRLSHIAICNPLIGEFRIVPGMVEGCICLQLTNSDTFGMYGSFGLNGDNGYEFFKIVYEFRNGEPVLEGKAYSLTNNTWRKIDIKMGDVDHLENHSKPCDWYQIVPVYVHGVFYWAATDYNVGYVVSFDVGKDAFDVGKDVLDVFLAPYNCSNEGWKLCDLKEEVAVVLYHDSRPLNIWVLNEREKSWELKLKMKEGNKIREFPCGIVTVLGRVGCGELVVEDYNDETLDLFLYDMYTNDVKDLPYVNVGMKREVFLYTESLVSVNAGDDVEEIF